MKTIAKYAAVASVLALTAGPAAWAQGYSNSQGSYGSNHGSYGQSYQGSENQGFQRSGQNNQGPNMQGNSEGQQGASNQFEQNSQGWNTNNMSASDVKHELSKYGYKDIDNVNSSEGWSADAKRNGHEVHVVVGENGQIATFRGVQSENNQGFQGSSSDQQFEQNSENGNGNDMSYSSAEHELSKYGYKNVRNVRPMQVWSADAKKSGDKIHVIVGDNGSVATFRGK